MAAATSRLEVGRVYEVPSQVYPRCASSPEVAGLMLVYEQYLNAQPPADDLAQRVVRADPGHRPLRRARRIGVLEAWHRGPWAALVVLVSVGETFHKD